MVQTANVTTRGVPQRRNKTNFVYSDKSTEHPDSNNASKICIEGGLYCNEKFDKIENINKKNPVSD